MWIRSSENQLHNLNDVRLLKMMEVENGDGEKLWAIRGFYGDNEMAMTLYLSKDKNAMETVMDNFEQVLQCGRVIKIKKEEESSDA